MNLQTINASASPEVQMNENFDSLNFAAVYGKRHPATTGLTWGYNGGRWNGFSVSDGTLSLSNAATNYIVVARSTGVISVSTTSTNWDNTASYARVYKLTTAGSVVTATEDHRAGLYGAHGPISPGTVGKHMIPIMAGAMKSRVSNGCANLATIEITSGPNLSSLDFDPSTQEYAQFSMLMPKSWNGGTVTFRPVWSHAATTTNFGVAWTLAGVVFANDAAMGVAFGTAQSSVDTGGTTDDIYVGPESSAITLAGTPADECIAYFQVSRNVSDGGDTMAVDARLIGVLLYITTDAENDA